MEKIMNFKSVKNKLYLSFSIVIIAGFVLGIYNFISVGKTNNDVNEIVNEGLPLIIAGEETTSNISHRTGLVRSFLLYEKSEYRNQFDKERKESAKLEKNLLQLVDTEQTKDLFEQKALWEESLNDVLAAYESGSKEKAIEIMSTEVEPLESEIRAGFEELFAHSESLMAKEGQSVLSNGETTLFIIIVVTLLVAALSIVIELLTVRIISDPIIRVMDRMKLIAKGDLSNKPLETNLKDETGQLVMATNDMNNNTYELLHKINVVSEAVSSQSEELSQSANEVKTGSEQVAVTMGELSSGSEAQANSSSDLALIMGVFTSKVQETNGNGELIQQASNEVLEMTNEGGTLMASSTKQMARIDQIVKDAVEKVKDLDRQSQEISNLVNVIEDIAKQTNLLALNAAIEAARAGEHGKGFAVVADEVRKLAGKVSDSVTDITDIVTSIQRNSSLVTDSLQSSYTEVEQGTSQLKTTRETFDGISLFVSEMVNIIKGVTDNLSEMTANSQQMNGSIQEIASVAEESAAGVEQTSAAAQQTSSSMEEVAGSSEQLAKLAEDLSELVHRFKI